MSHSYLYWIFLYLLSVSIGLVYFFVLKVSLSRTISGKLNTIGYVLSYLARLIGIGVVAYFFVSLGLEAAIILLVGIISSKLILLKFPTLYGKVS